jgi:nucleotide-binding universal stress UspA family protein
MSIEDTTFSKLSDEKKEKISCSSSSLLARETWKEEDGTKNAKEKRVLVVTPAKAEYDGSQVLQYSSLSSYSKEEEKKKAEKEQPSTSDRTTKEAGQSFKDDLVKPANKKATSSTNSQFQPSDANSIEYNRILVPHDGSQMSDKALNHAIYLSKNLASAELVILSVLQRLGDKDSSALLVTSKGEGGGKANKKEEQGGEEGLEITVEGNVKNMIEDRIRLCKEYGVKSQISYKIQTGKPVDEIVKLSEEMDVSLIVMASSRITSSIKVLGSTTRRVIDNAKRPVLVIHQ